MKKILNERFQKHQQIGQGGYATVYRGIDCRPHLQDKITKFDKPDPPSLMGLDQNSPYFANLASKPKQDEEDKSSQRKEVALKKIKNSTSKERGIDFTVLREIKFLGQLKHPNIIRLYDVFYHKYSIYLALEYARTDFEKLIQNKANSFEERDIRSFFKQILEGIAHLHANFILHRDLKPSNLLITDDGVLKYTDFGMARNYGTPREFTKGVVTLWYRAPELLYGASYYGPAIDMWSVGCIFAQILMREPIFPGSSEIDQLSKIFAILGPAQEENWPGVTTLPNYLPFICEEIRPLKNILMTSNQEALNLVSKLLTLDPNQRLSATEALEHPFLKDEDDISSPKELAAKFIH